MNDQVSRAVVGPEPCPVCHVPMIIEDGLWYCDQCDAYHGEAS